MLLLLLLLFFVVYKLFLHSIYVDDAYVGLAAYIFIVFTWAFLFSGMSAFKLELGHYIAILFALSNRNEKNYRRSI